MSGRTSVQNPVSDALSSKPAHLSSRGSHHHSLTGERAKGSMKKRNLWQNGLLLGMAATAVRQDAVDAFSSPAGGQFQFRTTRTRTRLRSERINCRRFPLAKEMSSCPYHFLLHRHTFYRVPRRSSVGTSASSSSSEASPSPSDDDKITDASDTPGNQNSSLKTIYPILLTSVAGILGFTCSSQISDRFSSSLLQPAFATLMVSMGTSLTKSDAQVALRNPQWMLWNAILCFGMMPLLAKFLSGIFRLSPAASTGTILLGCVSGGQASNLFTLLAGGNVALSVACTVSTTILGVIATPLLCSKFLVVSTAGTVVSMRVRPVLQSIASLVLAPLTVGWFTMQMLPKKIATRIRRIAPSIGLLATLILVAGGAANSAAGSGSFGSAFDIFGIVVGSILLPALGGMVAALLLFKGAPHQDSLPERKAVVIETLSKSPTLAYVLASQYFPSATAIPAASMVTLAILGSIVAAIYKPQQVA